MSEHRPNFSLSKLSEKHLGQPSKQTENKVREMICYSRLNGVNVSKLNEMIKHLPLNEDILLVYDEHHYNFNLLQTAVEFGHTEIINHLMQTYGLNFNHHSPPLHLASFCGHDNLVKSFLSHGESLELRANISLPVLHKLRHRFTADLDIKVRRETVEMLNPFQCAILADQSNCLRLLLSHVPQSMKKNEHIYASQWLHLACKHNAHDCTQILLTKYPDIINIPDENRFTPLYNAVHCGRTILKILFDHGATMEIKHNVTIEIKPGMYGTILHKLFSYSMMKSGSFYETTKCFLELGLKKHINKTNSNGDTALNLLIEHMSNQHLTKNLHHWQPNHYVLPWPRYQVEFSKCLELLLEYGADPHLPNSSGLTPLNKILHIAFEESVCRNLNNCHEIQPMTCICENLLISRCQNSNFIVNLYNEYGYRINFWVLCHVIDLLLSHKADPNAVCKRGHTPLKLWLMCFTNVYPALICKDATHIIKILTILLSHGANPNFSACSSFITKAATQFFQFPLSTGRDGEQFAYAKLVNQCLSVLLKYGFNPNGESKKQNFNSLYSTGNCLLDFVCLSKMVETYEEFEILYMWIKTLMQWGADPNMRPNCPGKVIYHSRDSIFLQEHGAIALSEYMIILKKYQTFYKEDYAEKLLQLFYKTMDHEILYNCLNEAQTRAQFHLQDTSKDYLQLLKDLTSNPRSLREIARVSIYKSLGHQLIQKVHSLPLPHLLQTYILEIQ